MRPAITRIGISLKAVVSAIRGCGDVAYALDEKNWPHGLNFGLTLGARSERVHVAAGWKRARGQLAEPTPLPNVAVRIAQPVELIQWGGAARGRSVAG
jgi:hypothetical protein